MIGVNIILVSLISLVSGQLSQYQPASTQGQGASRQGQGTFSRPSPGGGSNVIRGGGGGGGDHQGLDWLRDSVPGEPGVDYPVYSLPVPDNDFSCNGRVEGGYYSDPALQCQAFHICVRSSLLDLTKYSFLCPNGSLFDQQYFICDFWFNVDCSQAETLYSLNDALAAEREANIGALAPENVLGGARGAVGGNSLAGRAGNNNVNRGGNNGRNRNRGNRRPDTGYGAPRVKKSPLSNDTFYELLESNQENLEDSSGKKEEILYDYYQ